jgi:putative ABC transport system substrate-binding protein
MNLGHLSALRAGTPDILVGRLVRRRAVVASLGLVVTTAAAAQPRAVRLGLLSTGQYSIDSFLRWGLPELERAGFVLGRNLTLTAHSSRGDPNTLDALAIQILATWPDVMVAASNPAAHAILRNAPSMPIVMSFAGNDPVADGLAQSLARPGGTVTGVVMLAQELNEKRLELARDLRPGVRRIGFLAGSTYSAARIKSTMQAANALGLAIDIVQAGGSESYGAAVSALQVSGAEVVVIGSFPEFAANAATLAGHARAAGLGTICEWPEMAQAGCLIGFGPILEELVRRVGIYVVRILRGEPADSLPMEQASRFGLTINLRTAQALGLTVPAALLARADEVIE